MASSSKDNDITDDTTFPGTKSGLVLMFCQNDCKVLHFLSFTYDIKQSTNSTKFLEEATSEHNHDYETRLWIHRSSVNSSSLKEHKHGMLLSQCLCKHWRKSIQQAAFKNSEKTLHDC